MAARRNRGKAALYNRPKRKDDNVAKPSQTDALADEMLSLNESGGIVALFSERYAGLEVSFP